jgi:protein-S-isoprenylcysteine O-methyltransferase Ste14
MQEFQKRIEDRAQKRGSRLARTPIVLSSGLLYFSLYVPVLITSMLSNVPPSNPIPTVGMMVMKALVVTQWMGYIMGAVADLTKSYVKESKKDGKFLVTSGIFSLLRHPNYTGEIIAWTSSQLCATVATAYMLQNKFSTKLLGLFGLSMIGWIGIMFVLLQATSGLEKRQKEEYGDTERYKNWVASTWSGWMLPPKQSSTSSETTEPHEITLDDETEEESGSGI